MTNPTGDIEGLKARLKSTWMAGDFGEIAKSLVSHAEEFIERRSIKPGMRVLDVACGTGNTAIPAAKAGASVTGVDIATNLLEQGRIRASIPLVMNLWHDQCQHSLIVLQRVKNLQKL